MEELLKNYFRTIDYVRSSYPTNEEEEKIKHEILATTELTKEFMIDCAIAYGTIELIKKTYMRVGNDMFSGENQEHFKELMKEIIKGE